MKKLLIAVLAAALALVTACASPEDAATVTTTVTATITAPTTVAKTVPTTVTKTSIQKTTVTQVSQVVPPACSQALALAESMLKKWAEVAGKLADGSKVALVGDYSTATDIVKQANAIIDEMTYVDVPQYAQYRHACTGN